MKKQISDEKWNQLKFDAENVLIPGPSNIYSSNCLMLKKYPHICLIRRMRKNIEWWIQETRQGFEEHFYDYDIEKRMWKETDVGLEKILEIVDQETATRLLYHLEILS